jgi:hypothetical protein
MPGSGRDTILNFDDGNGATDPQDRIDLSQFNALGIDDVSDLNIEYDAGAGRDAVITDQMGAGIHIVINSFGHDVEDPTSPVLTADDFIF